MFGIWQSAVQTLVQLGIMLFDIFLITGILLEDSTVFSSFTKRSYLNVMTGTRDCIHLENFLFLENHVYYIRSCRIIPEMR